MNHIFAIFVKNTTIALNPQTPEKPLFQPAIKNAEFLTLHESPTEVHFLAVLPKSGHKFLKISPIPPPLARGAGCTFVHPDEAEKYIRDQIMEISPSKNNQIESPVNTYSQSDFSHFWSWFWPATRILRIRSDPAGPSRAPPWAKTRLHPILHQIRQICLNWRQNDQFCLCQK